MMNTIRTKFGKHHIWFFFILVMLASCEPTPSNDDSITAERPGLLDVQTDLFKSLYSIECNPRRDERRAVINHDLTLTNNADIEEFRCVKHVKGTLIIDAEKLVPTPSNLPPYPGVPNSIMTVFTLPWLERVDGEFRLITSAWLTKGQFPKLTHVGGKIFIDNRLGQALWIVPTLETHDDTLEVLAGVTNTLDGFSSLTHFKKLHLRTHPNDIHGPFNFSGLDAVESGGSIEVNLRSVSVSGSFLENLHTINDDVEIHVKDSNMFALPALQTIGDRLTIENSPFIPNLSGFSAVTALGGLELVDNVGLNDVTDLHSVNLSNTGYIEIAGNNALGDCEAKQLVRELRNDPNWSNFSSSNTTVSGNGFPDC